MSHEQGDSEGHKPDDEVTDSPFGHFTFYVLGVVTAIVVWAVLSFVVPIVDTGIAGVWPLPLPEGKTSYGELALVLITAVYVWASLRQWRVSQEALRLTRVSLHETRRANELTLRAWVLVESADYTEGDRSVSVTVRNYGKLPAIQVVALHKLVGGPTYLYPEPPDGAAPELGTIGAIGAGLAHTYEFPLDHVLFDELAAARRGERRGGLTLHLFSRFRYTDALGTRGHTTYSAVLLGGGRSAEIPGGSSVS